MTGTGVLLTAFGGPRDPGGVEPFMRSILGGAPPQAALDETRRRYAALGGASPLVASAERIARLLAQRLSAEEEVPVVVGMLHSDPSIASAMAALAKSGVERVICVSLSPFEAESTTGSYRRAIEAAASAHPAVTVVEAPGYSRSAAFVAALTDEAAAALRSVGGAHARTLVAFTAHSLPVADVEADPTYVDQLRLTAEAVAASVALGPADGFQALPGVSAYGGHSGDAPWLLAFQSKGRRGGEWLGPDLDEVVDAAAAQGFGAIVVSPIGFAIDHMETLYDLDVAAAARARDAGLVFTRAMAPNDADSMIDALVASVREAL
jgi:ferrochelatase